jgi:hypothetical protein
MTSAEPGPISRNFSNAVTAPHVLAGDVSNAVTVEVLLLPTIQRQSSYELETRTAVRVPITSAVCARNQQQSKEVLSTVNAIRVRKYH